MKQGLKTANYAPDKFRLELLTDIDMLLMVEKGIRGGITQAVKRYAKANNKYMSDLCNPDEKSIYLQYLNANNLYVWAMVQNLPTHGFKWENGEGFTSEKIDELVEKDKEGYLLEVDVKYPKKLHEIHNGLPLLVEKMKIKSLEKLMPNLKRKRRYLVQIKALDQALKHGLKLKKVHRVIKFQQNRGMKAYIMLNTTAFLGRTTAFLERRWKISGIIRI